MTENIPQMKTTNKIIDHSLNYSSKHSFHNKRMDFGR